MKWDIKDIAYWSWDKHPLGLAGLEPGNSVLVKTGNWRSKRPVVDAEKCNGCLVCFIFCPDAAKIKVYNKVITNYEHCKGCGICANECGRKAVSMVEEYATEE